MNVVLIDPYKKGEQLGYSSGRLKQSDQLMYSMGLGFIATELEKDGHDVTILDLKFPEIRTCYLDIVKRIKPNIVGITVAITTFKEASEITTHLRENNFSGRIIWGGAFPTLYWKECFELNQEIDIIVIGEGEETITELCKHIDSSKDFSDKDRIPGIAFRQNGNIFLNENRSYIKDLDKLNIAFDKFSILNRIPNPLEYRRLPHAQLLTSRGCPFNCAFCHKPVLGSGYRFESAQKTYNNIKKLIDEYGIKSIGFLDDTFTLRKNRVYELCDRIVNNNIKIDFNIKTRLDLVDYNMLKRMKKAGLWMLGFGVESASQESLNLLKKGIRIEQIESAIRYCKELKIKVRASFMINIPGETYEMMDDTIKFAQKLNPFAASFNITTPLPHTELYQICKTKGHLAKGGIIDNADNIDYSTFDDPLYINECADKDTLHTIAKKAYRNFYLRFGWFYGRTREIDSIHDILRYLRLIWTYRHMLKIK